MIWSKLHQMDPFKALTLEKYPQYATRVSQVETDPQETLTQVLLKNMHSMKLEWVKLRTANPL